MEQSPVACLLLAADDDAPNPGRIRLANEAARRVFALDPETTSVDVLDLLDDDSARRTREAIAHLVSAGGALRLSFEVRVAAADTAPPQTMQLRRQQDGQIVAQLLPQDGHDEIERVLAEQQRFRSALLELSALAHTTTDDDEFYQRLLERAVDVVPGAQGGSVQLVLDGTESFRFVAAVGYDLEGLQRHLLEQKHFFRDAWNPAARIVREFSADGRTPEITEWLETVGRLNDIVVNVSAPVLVDGFPVAFLSLDNFEDPNALTQASVEMTTVLSRLIGDLWMRRRLEAELRKEREAFRHQALHDPLTQLPNRRNLERRLSETIDVARAKSGPSAVLFVDIDDFKGVNDRLGHDVGDMLLRGVGNGLAAVAGPDDAVGRWGGDEFLILPSNVSTPAAVQALADRILDRFETDLDLDEDGLTYRARISVGIGWCDDSATTPSALITIADEALYAAKAAGKGVTRFRTSSGSEDLAA